MPPRAVTRSTAKLRKRSDDAPRHCGSLGGKCTPMSPSASAPRMASVSACSADVGVGMAGERCGVRDPHAAEPDVVAAGPKACTSIADAGADVAERVAICIALGARRNPPACVILMLPRLAREHRDRQPGPFGERRVVGEIVAALRAARGDAPRAGQRRRRPAASAPCADVARSSVAVDDAVGVDELDRVGDRQAPGSRRRCACAAAIARATSAAVANGRAASWTSTMSGACGCERLEPGAHRGLPRRAAKHRRQQHRSPAAAAENARVVGMDHRLHEVDLPGVRRTAARLCADHRRAADRPCIAWAYSPPGARPAPGCDHDRGHADRHAIAPALLDPA